MIKAGDYWTEADIKASKQRIKDELDQRQQQGGPEARQQMILDRLKEFESSQKPKELLDLFIYLVSALVNHSRFPFLNPSRYEKRVFLMWKKSCCTGLPQPGGFCVAGVMTLRPLRSPNMPHDLCSPATSEHAIHSCFFLKRS